MPYKNIHWIKLKFLDLLTDPEHRFIELLNDEQKGLYLMLLMLMGFYHNQIPLDPKSIKRSLNLTQEESKISENIAKICDVFSRAIRKSHVLKFKNYNKLHNPVGNSKGTPKDGVEERRVDKSRLEEIISFYGEKQKMVFKEKNTLYWLFFKRSVRPAKSLLQACGDLDKAKQAITGIGDLLDSKGMNWSLETIVKWYPDYSVKGNRMWEKKSKVLSRTDLQ